MANKLLSISLGTGTAKLAEIATNGKRVFVYSAYDITLSEGLCDDGLILDVEALAGELKSYISKYRIKCKKLVFSIASKRIASKEVIIPFVKEKQISEIVNLNGAEYFPVANIDDYSLNHSIIEIVKSAENKQYRLSVTATPKELLESYNELAKLLKMPIEVIDYAGNAILQVLKKQALDSEVDAVLQLGRENTVINIMTGGVLVMQRSVSYGLDAILQAVSDSFHLDDEDTLAFIEDNEISRICSAYPDVDDVVRTIFTSVSRIFDFYNQRSNGHPITAIRFIGDGTIINGIGDAIQDELSLPTEEILTLNQVDVKGKAITAERATNFMANIGAIIAPVNMKYVKKDEEEAEKKEEKLPWGLLALSIVGAIVLVGASFATYYFAKQERDELKAQLNTIAEAQQIEERYNSIATKKSTLDNLYASTTGYGDSLVRMIADLEEKMPSDMTITAINVTDGVVTLTAGCNGKESVAKFIQGMKDLSYIRGIKAEYISENFDDIETYDTFNIKFDLLNVDEIEAAANDDTIVIENETEPVMDGGEQ